MTSFFVTGGGLNNSAYANARLDTLLDAARILTRPDQRRRVYADVMNILNEDLPYLFLWWEDMAMALRKQYTLKGLNAFSFEFGQWIHHLS